MIDSIITQLIALVTFFAFPALQYLIFKRFSKKQGQPELWYLPAYGFRLVIRNIPNNRTLSEIKAKTIIRQTIPANINSSVSTFQDKTIFEFEDLFLLPQSDKILLSFRIDGSETGKLNFIQTDKLGSSISIIPFDKIDELISDYSANLENLLNFDIKIMKRVSISKKLLEYYWSIISLSSDEQRLNNIEVLNIG